MRSLHITFLFNNCFYIIFFGILMFYLFLSFSFLHYFPSSLSRNTYSKIILFFLPLFSHSKSVLTVFVCFSPSASAFKGFHFYFQPFYYSIFLFNFIIRILLSVFLSCFVFFFFYYQFILIKFSIYFFYSFLFEHYYYFNTKFNLNTVKGHDQFSRL